MLWYAFTPDIDMLLVLCTHQYAREVSYCSWLNFLSHAYVANARALVQWVRCVFPAGNPAGQNDSAYFEWMDSATALDGDFVRHFQR